MVNRVTTMAADTNLKEKSILSFFLDKMFNITKQLDVTCTYKIDFY